MMVGQIQHNGQHGKTRPGTMNGTNAAAATNDTDATIGTSAAPATNGTHAATATNPTAATNTTNATTATNTTAASDTTNAAVAPFITLRGFKNDMTEMDGTEAIEFDIPTTDFPQKVIQTFISVDGKSSFDGIVVGDYLLIALDFDSLGTNTLAKDISTLSTVLTHVRDQKEHDRILAYLGVLKKYASHKESVAAYNYNETTPSI